MPTIYKEAEKLLTSYGMSMFNKHVQASGNYNVSPVHHTLGEEAFDFAPVDRSLATADPNLVDHPRCITADRLREELPVGAESARGCPVATSGRCLALSPVRPSTQAF